jgi:hypothetical protein
MTSQFCDDVILKIKKQLSMVHSGDRTRDACVEGGHSIY